jgi:DNA-binding PadR family transcriptional regulator
MDKEEIDDALMELLNAGYIEVEYNEKLEATFKVTEAGKSVVKDILRDLDEL